MAILEPFPGKEEDTLTLLREFYTFLHNKGYSQDLLYRDARASSRYVHVRIWLSDQARSEAQQDPEVHRFWMRLAEICTIKTIYEELEPVFSTYDPASMTK